MSSKKNIGIGDDRSPVERVYDTSMNYGKLAMSLSPIALGIKMGIQDAGNRSRGFSNMTSYSSVRDINSNVGKNLHDVSMVKRQLRTRAIESIQGEIQTAVNIESIVKKAQAGDSRGVQELNSLLNTLSSMLDDPDVVGKISDKDAKNKIMNVIEREIENISRTNIDELSQITNRISEVASEKAYELSKFRLNQFSSISSQLASPLDLNGIRSPIDFVDLQSGFSSRTQSSFKQIRNLLGGAASVEMVAIAENTFKTSKGTGVGEYLKITGRNQDSFLIPTNLSDVRRKTGANIVRLRGGTTSYAAPAAFINASQLNAAMGEGSFTSSSIVDSLDKFGKNRLALTFEDYTMNLFMSRVRSAGGFSSFNSSKFFQEVNQFADQIYPGSTSATAKRDVLNRALFFSSQAKIVGMESLTKEDRKFMMSRLGTNYSDIFDPFANISQTEATLSGSRFTSVGLRGLPSMSYSGINPRSVSDEIIQLPGVNRVIDPLTARAQQQYNTLGQFENNRGVFFLDYKKDAMTKLGFGDGQGYIMNQSPVREVTVKSVMSGSSLKRSNAVFTNELIARAKLGEAERVLRVRSGSTLNIVTQDARAKLAGTMKGYLSKDAIDDLMTNGKFTFSGNQQMYKGQLNSFFKAFGGRDQPGIVLGMIDDRVITIPKFQGIQSFDIGINSVSRQAGREILKMDLTTSVSAGNINKIFSTLGKITGRNMTASTFAKNMGIMGFDDISKVFDVNDVAESIIITDASMAKKGVYNANFQMASAFTYFRNRKLGLAQTDNISGAFKKALAANLEASAVNFNDLNVAAGTMKKAYSQAVIDTILKESKDLDLSAKEMGLIFGGLSQRPEYFGFEKAGETFNEGMEYFKSSYKRIFDSGVTKNVLTEIGKGVGFARDYIYAGPRASMNRRNVGKTSARTTTFLEQKLKAAGFKDENISDFMFSYLSRRTDLDDNIVMSNRLGQMGLSMAGTVAPGKSMQMAENLKTVNVFDFIRSVSGSEEQALDFLRRSDFSEGFILDFAAPEGASTTQLASSKKMQTAIERYTKSKSGMYFAAGEEFMDSISRFSTDIEKTEGIQRILPTYVKRVHSFANDLIKIQNISLEAEKELQAAQKAVLNFREEIGTMFGEAFHRVSKGEQAGSAYSQTSFLQIGPEGMRVDNLEESGLGRIVKTSTDISDSQEAAFRRLFKFTPKSRKPGVVFYDTQAFLSSYASLEKGLMNEEYQRRLNKAIQSGQSVDDIAKASLRKQSGTAVKKMKGEIFKAFFMGTHEAEAGITSAEHFRGFDAINVRNPDLGPGHIAISSGYRNLGELTFDQQGIVTQDNFFDEFVKTEKGKSSLQKLERQFKLSSSDPSNFRITSFQQIAKLRQLEGDEAIVPKKYKLDDMGEMILDEDKMKKLTITRQSQQRAIDDFFSDLSHVSLNELQGEGGGRTIFPSFVTDVHFGKEKYRIDFALSGGMLADADGDINNMFIASKKMVQGLEAADINAYNKLISDQIAHTFQVQYYKEMSDAGMKAYGKKLSKGIEMTASSMIAQDILKEHGAKNIGPLDVTMGAIRQGAVNISEDKTSLNSLLSALVSIQEAGNIKGKKLDFYQAFEEDLNIQLRSLIESEGATKEEFKSFLKNTVFYGQEGKMTGGVGAFDTSAIFDEDIQKMVQSSFRDTRLLTVDEIAERTTQAAINAKTNNLMQLETVQRTGKYLSSLTGEEKSLALRRSLQNNVFGQMAMGAMDSFGTATDNKALQMLDTYSDVFRNTKGMQKSLAGPIALGAFASMGLSAMLGYQGYSPEPLLMPGEVSDYGVGNAIRNGSIYDTMHQGPSPEELMARQNNVMMDRPINDSFIRAEVGSAFSINGEAISASHGQAMVENVVMRGGRGHMIINDNRMPITKNYINRILGE